MGEANTQRYVIIVAGGTGTRMNSPVPKQFLKLDGKPVLMHTINKFVSVFPDIKIVLVLPQDQTAYWKQLCNEFNFQVEVKIASSGESRFYSVKNGLQLITGNGVVAVHDGVRPLVSTKTIVNGFKAAEMYGNSVPAIPLNDSIRQIDSTRNIAVDRTKYCIIQTPQCFSVELLKKAYTQEYKFTYTDDASVVEALGEKIHLIDGNVENIKITNPQDLIIAEALLKQPAATVVTK